MESEKENVNRLKTSRIPVPVKPALLKHLVEPKKRLMNEERNKRRPLKTINCHQHLALPGPSQKTKQIQKPKDFKVVNTQYVTLRHKADNLGLENKIYKDVHGKEDNVILLCNDEDLNNKVGLKLSLENKRRHRIRVSRSVTPVPVLKDFALMPNTVKNIKRLKIPHSRELQRISPLAQEKKSDKKIIRRSLHSSEPLQDGLTPDFLKILYMGCFERDYVLDMFGYLLKTEQRHVIPKISSTMRAGVINWLVNINGADGNPVIIQTAVWYLDSVLFLGQLQIDKLQLIAAACYWIAHKLHGSGLSAGKLVQWSSDAFSAKCLMDAELAVLKRLKFPPQPVVAQEYITYLTWWCGSGSVHPGEIEMAATFLCISGLMVDKSLCNEWPSVIAASAVSNAILLLMKTDLMEHLQMCPVFKSAAKKATNMTYTCFVLRRAVRTFAEPTFAYRTLFKQYGTAPSYVAQRIIHAANELSDIELQEERKYYQ